MTKIYLHKNLSIVLTIIAALLSSIYGYYIFTMYQISLVQPDALQDPGFKYKFIETVAYALIFLSLATYFAIKAFLDKPLIEVRYEDEFIYEEITEETEDENEDENEEASEDEESEEDKK
jgi:hypothetical protein